MSGFSQTLRRLGRSTLDDWHAATGAIELIWEIEGPPGSEWEEQTVPDAHAEARPTRALSG